MPNKNPPTPCDLLSVSEAAKICKVSQGHLYNLVARDEIPFHRIGNVIRFHLPEILQSTRRGRSAQDMQPSAP